MKLTAISFIVVNICCFGWIYQLKNKNKAISDEMDLIIVSYNQCEWEKLEKELDAKNEKFWLEFYDDKYWLDKKNRK